MNEHVRPPRGAEPLPDSPDPVEIALDQQRHDPAPDSPARRLLIDQGRLIRTQIASERMGVALKLLTAVAGIAVAAALGVMAWDASRTEALVVQPFSVPPELAARGVTGQVTATRLLDGLAVMQGETISARAPESYANDWGDEVQVQIPQTGVSIGELQDALRGWLGKETGITGEVIRTAEGYAVTARTGAEPGKTFTGPEAELDALIRKASEAVYESTQPEGYAAWLRGKGRTDEAAAIHERLTISGPRERRAWAFAEWAAYGKTPEVQLERAQRAVALDADLPVAHQVLAGAHRSLGHDEAAFQARRRAVTLLEGRRAEDMAPWAAVLQLKETRADIASALGDHAGAAALYVSAAEPTPDQPPVACRQCSSNAWYQAATHHAAMGDGAGMRRMASRGAALLPSYAPLYGKIHAVSLAAALEDWPALERALTDPVLTAYVRQAAPHSELRSLRPSLAVAMAKTGRFAEARRLVETTPLDCHSCVVARGQVAAAAGDRAGAERWLGQSARMAPSLPTAPLALARARLDRGDVKGALSAVRTARKLAPDAPEALKLEADALTRRGDHDRALRLYAQAAEGHSRSGRLHLAWGRALQAAGERKAARAKWTAASRMDLSAADRAQLQALLARPA